jgi:hypothetical protein
MMTMFSILMDSHLRLEYYAAHLLVGKVRTREGISSSTRHMSACVMGVASELVVLDGSTFFDSDGAGGSSVARSFEKFQTTWMGLASRSSNSARRLAPSDSGSVRRTLPEESCALPSLPVDQANSMHWRILLLTRRGGLVVVPRPQWRLIGHVGA